MSAENGPDLIERLRAGITTGSAAETRAVAAAIAAFLPNEATVALHGDLGAGKTTFVQGLAVGLGIAEPITSPTFNVFTLHRRGSRLLVHLDAYRLASGAQLDALMIDDFLAPPYCVAVEWPENVASWLPAAAWHLRLAIAPDGRHSLRMA